MSVLSLASGLRRAPRLHVVAGVRRVVVRVGLFEKPKGETMVEIMKHESRAAEAAPKSYTVARMEHLV